MKIFHHDALRLHENDDKYRRCLFICVHMISAIDCTYRKWSSFLLSFTEMHLQIHHYFIRLTVGLTQQITVISKGNDLMYTCQRNRRPHGDVKHTHFMCNACWVLQGVVLFIVQWQLERALNKPSSKRTHDDHMPSVLHLLVHCDDWSIWNTLTWWITQQFIGW